MRLSKYHGLGNDFLLLESSERLGVSADLAALARLLCDRHCGIGADGLIEIASHSESSDCRVRIFNSDGSEAEISGNGVRCVAAHWVRTGRTRNGSVAVDTTAGCRHLELLERDDPLFYFRADMGQPHFHSEQIPMQLAEPCAEVVNFPLSLGTDRVAVTAVSLGNPHASVFVEGDGAALAARLGPRITDHSVFPEHTNVEFVRVIETGRIRVWFWERGVGRTLSSGTGSCAAALAAMRMGHGSETVSVITDAGPLEVQWQPGQSVFLKGSSEWICDVEFDPPARSLCRRVM